MNSGFTFAGKRVTVFYVSQDFLSFLAQWQEKNVLNGCFGPIARVVPGFSVQKELEI